VKQEIVGFNQDDMGDWVAELACGHAQHVRHKPPWQNRESVVTEQGRMEKIGMKMECKLCDVGA